MLLSPLYDALLFLSRKANVWCGLLMLLLLPFFAVAQTASGYLGYRYSIGYSAYLSPSLFNPNANSSDHPTSGPGFNSTHCINVEYSYKTRLNLCGSIEFSKAGMKTTQYSYMTDPLPGYSADYGYISYRAKDKTPMTLRTTNISIGFKLFPKGFIAPVGRYQKLEFVLLFDKAVYKKNSFYDYDNDKFFDPSKKAYSKFRSFAFAYTLGRQRIFFNRLILDTGFRFGISPNFVINFIGHDMFISDNSPSFDLQLKKNVNKRIMGAELINFHIGLSFLAF